MVTQNILMAIGLGFIPTLLWVWFWIKGRSIERQTAFIMFGIGVAMVALALFIEFQLQDKLSLSSPALWATVEEIIKAIFFILLIKLVDRSKILIAIILYALGYAASENFLFAFGMLNNGDFTYAFSESIGRLLGATNIHLLTSLILAGSFFMHEKFAKPNKYIYLGFGIFVAVVLHTAFNVIVTT